MSGHTPIPGFPGYTIAPDGRVLSFLTNWRGYGAREMSHTPNADGYPSVRIRDAAGRRRRMAVHRLVASAFLGDRPQGAEVRHIDGDRRHCHVANLAWGTRQDNADDREKHGRTSRGLSHSLAIRAAIAKALGEQVTT